jgi:hypothetical protein
MSEIRTVWQSMSDDNGGICRVPGLLYWDWADAKRWAGHPDPQEQKVYVGDDGRMFLLSGEVRVYGSAIEREREVALAKLTKKDREVLGV